MSFKSSLRMFVPEKFDFYQGAYVEDSKEQMREPRITFSLLLQIIFRFALALFKCKEDEFLKLQDPMAIFKYLRYFTRTILDAR